MAHRRSAGGRSLLKKLGRIERWSKVVRMGICCGKVSISHSSQQAPLVIFCGFGSDAATRSLRLRNQTRIDCIHWPPLFTSPCCARPRRMCPCTKQHVTRPQRVCRCSSAVLCDWNSPSMTRTSSLRMRSARPPAMQNTCWRGGRIFVPLLTLSSCRVGVLVALQGGMSEQEIGQLLTFFAGGNKHAFYAVPCPLRARRSALRCRRFVVWCSCKQGDGCDEPSGRPAGRQAGPA